MCQVFLQGRQWDLKLLCQKFRASKMLMEAAYGPSEVAVLINCLPFKFVHVLFRAQSSLASISHHFLPLVVYYSVSMNYLLFSLMLPGLCLCCCSFYLECPYSLISTMNFYSLSNAHFKRHLLCKVFLNLPSRQATGDSLLSDLSDHIPAVWGSGCLSHSLLWSLQTGPT